MSHERYETAVTRSRDSYGRSAAFPLNRERYMDRTASLRAMRNAIEALQEGDRYMAKKQYGTAETNFERAIKFAKEDYTGPCDDGKVHACNQPF